MPPNDEWNRLEKLYEMRQKEQRRIEMANFQRVLAQADDLTKSMQALGYRTPLPREQKNRFDGTENSEIEKASEEGTYMKNHFACQPFSGSSSAPPITQEEIESANKLFSGLTMLTAEGIHNFQIENGGDWNDIKKLSNGLTGKYSLGGTPQYTYLLAGSTPEERRALQEKMFLKDGYLKGTPGDYGPTKRRAKELSNEDDKVPLPVYQTAPDNISTDPTNLIYLGEILSDERHNNWLGPKDAQLYHANAYGSNVYIDPYSGQMYTKAWDLNDYGGDEGQYSSTYGKEKNWFWRLIGKGKAWAANKLDDIGLPTVVTTGFQPVVVNSDERALTLKDLEQINKRYKHSTSEDLRGKWQDKYIDLYNLVDDYRSGKPRNKKEEEVGTSDFIRPSLLQRPEYKEAGYVNVLPELFITPKGNSYSPY